MALPVSMDIRFTNLSHTVIPEKKNVFAANPPPKTILHSVTGHLPSGKSLAILGPSGSGKTTLLNALAGRLPQSSLHGELLFNHRPRVARTKRRIGYVTQEDAFLPNLTVRQTLSFVADARLNRPKEERETLVSQLLESLGLSNCQHTRIGDNLFDKGISGGERKRLSVAAELIHSPSLLLADEVTSGLDSSSALAITRFLSDFCTSGRSVIATIHQPSSQVFNLFDSIMLLAAGRVAYFGSTKHMVRYFESIDFPFPRIAFNPADYVLELIIDDAKDYSSSDESGDNQSTQETILNAWKVNGQSLLRSFEQAHVAHVKEKQSNDSDLVVVDMDFNKSTKETSSESEESQEELEKAIDPSQPTTRFGRMIRVVKKRFWDVTGQHGLQGEMDKYETNWFQQVRALARRSRLQKQGVLIQPSNLAQLIAVTIITGLLWFRMELRERTIEDRLGALALTLSEWAYGSALMAIFSYPLEKKVVTKDRAGGSYRLSAYYFGTSLVEISTEVIYPIAFSAVIYYVIGLNPAFSSFILFTLILSLTVLTAQSIGILISAAVKNIQQAQTVAFVWIMLSVILSGYYLDPDNLRDIVQPLRKLSFVTYAYEAMIRTEMLGGRTFPCETGGGPNTVYSDSGRRCPIDAEALLRGAHMENSLSIGGNIAVLLGWVVVVRLLGYFALKWLHIVHKPRMSGKA